MHRARIALVAVTSFAALALSLGCGGAAYTSAFDDPAADGGPTDDASPILPDGAPRPDAGKDAGHPDTGSPWSPVCPDALPANGGTCYGDNLQCEYGGASWNVSCDKVVQCQNGQWWSYSPSYEPCTPEPGPNSPSCPASYGAVPQGASCTATGLSCTYPQAVCSCQFPLGGPVELDAGNTGYWGCAPENGCPFPRPRLGSACASEGANCTYEACSYAQTCSGGIWQGQEEACEGVAGGRPNP